MKLDTLYLSGILIAAGIPAYMATPASMENFEQFVQGLHRRELLAADRAIESMRQSFSFIQDERAVVVVAELGRLLEIVREVVWGDVKHAQLIDEPR